MLPNSQLARLRNSLLALAAEGSTQLNLFPPTVCKADELALDFDNGFRCVTESDVIEITTRQRHALEAIDGKLAWMSDPDKVHLWTEESVLTATDWQEVREMAKVALEAFGWAIEPPSENLEEVV